MSTLIFGVGLGTFLILTLWLSAGLICLISLRTQKKLGLVASGVVGIVTIALISVPRSSEDSDVSDDKLYDHLFVWRTLLAVLLGASSLVAVSAYVKFELMTPIKAAKIKNWVH